MKLTLVLLSAALIGCAQQPKAVTPKQKTKEAPKEAECVVGAQGVTGCSGSGIRCVAPGKWEYFHDEVIAALSAKEENARREMYWALRTRVLTVAEMETVEGMDLRLVVPRCSSYNEEEKRRELNDALLQQFRIRLAAEKAK